MDAQDAALARLTENERECLRRRLRPQTAKEIAADLGISPHAVEKRLKMARAKLGTTSSLAAARLLATHEARYQPLVPQLSDLASSSPPPETGSGRSTVRRPSFRTILAGGATMSILILAAAALTIGEMHPPGASRAEATAFLEREFARLDRDRSGAIDPLEAPKAMERVSAPGGYSLKPMADGTARWIGFYDRDPDGRVVRDEYVRGSLPAVERDGIPALAKPSR